jgi:hypothetical protein
MSVSKQSLLGVVVIDTRLTLEARAVRRHPDVFSFEFLF